MKPNCKKTGWTLTELLVVMAVMAILMGISVPAAKKLIESFEGSTGARSIIDAALSNARAIAVREQRYAGVRFQADLSGKQYLVFIIHDQQNTNLANGFRTVEGRKPMPLPKNIGVISEKYKTNTELFDSAKYTEAISCSVVFSPAGRFVIHDVRFKGKMMLGAGTIMLEDVKNYQSVNTFLIYDIKKFAVVPSNNRWDGYLEKLNAEYVNPYTGQVVKK